MNGSINYHAGLAAEGSVERHLMDRGLSLVARRWRGKAGEIDLVMREGAVTVFVEVKRAATHALAATRLSTRQAMRIMRAGEEFVGRTTGSISADMRFDLALVDGAGQVQMIPNALWAA